MHGEGKRFYYPNTPQSVTQNKVQILNENVDKESQNTHVEVNIFARQTSKAQSRVKVVQNSLHIAET